MCKVVLSKEDCYCGLEEFYTKVAQKAGLTVTKFTQFNCKKICVSKPVQDELRGYYMHERKKDIPDTVAIFACFGPKSNLETDGSQLYLAEIEEGFLCR